MKRPRGVPLHQRLSLRSAVQGDCLVWTGSQNQAGYGTIGVGNKVRYVHHIAYEISYGPIPDGVIIRHSCDNPPCWRLGHLIPGTMQNNTDDMFERGRSATRLTTASESKALRSGGSRVTASFSLDVGHLDWLKQGARGAKRSASAVLRSVIDAAMAAERHEQSAEGDVA